MTDPSCNAAEAVARAQSIVGQGGQYLLGSGDYRPRTDAHGKVTDLPWTYGPDGTETGSDCAGFAICWAWKLHRSRPGFNVGAWASVESAINCNSALEDGVHRQELFTTLPAGSEVRPGDLLLYPTFSLKLDDGSHKTFIGHVGFVESVPPNFTYGDWRRLSIIQCHGPNHYKPGVVRTDGSVFAHHDVVWPKPEHRCHIIRVKERP